MEGMELFCREFEKMLSEGKERSFSESVRRQKIGVVNSIASVYALAGYTYQGVPTVMLARFCNMLSVEAKFPFYAALYEACRTDYKKIPNVIFQHERLERVKNLIAHSGCDHSFYIYQALCALAVDDFSGLEALLPEELGLAKHGYWIPVICTNLLLAIYYKKPEYVEYCADKLETSLKRKENLYFKSILNCLADIFTKKPDAFNDDLENVCKGLQKSKQFGLEPFDKILSLEALGLYRLACLEFHGTDRERLKMPEHFAFWKEAAELPFDRRIEPYFVYTGELSFLASVYKGILYKKLNNGLPTY